MPMLAGLLITLALPAVGQSKDTFYTVGATPGAAGFFEVDASGRLLATFATMPTSLFHPSRVTMACDNRSLRVGSFTGTAINTGSVFEVNPMGVMRTIWSGLPLRWVWGLFPDENGDWTVMNYNATHGNLEFYRLSGTRLTSLGTAWGIRPYGAVSDPETGRLIVRSRAGYYRIDPVTGAYTTIMQFNGHGSYGVARPLYEPTTGTYLDTARPVIVPFPSADLIRLHPGQKMTTLANHPAEAYELAQASDRVRLAGSAAFYLHAKTRTQPWTVEIISLKADGSRIGSTPIQGLSVGARAPLVRKGARHLAWALNASPNDRSLLVSFPAESGRNYAVGLSLTGIRPCPRLADGRSIPIVPDALTDLCLKGGIPGILENTAGRLDRSGTARVKVHLNRLGPGLKGTKIWAAAVVLDPQAPSGVAAVDGPLLLTVN